MTRRFGVEVEINGSIPAMIRALNDAGIPTDDYGHTHTTGRAPRNWSVKRDGSVSAGGEIVSPPLDFDSDEDREQVSVVLRALQAAGCTTSKQAGIHVHVEAKNEDGSAFSYRQLGALVRFFYKFQDPIYRIASSGWRRHRGFTYCKPISYDLARKMQAVRTQSDFCQAWYNSNVASSQPYHLSRYHGINLHSFVVRGTVEFRVFNSSLNPERVQTYIALAMAITDDARKGYARSVGKSYKLGGMAAGETSEATLMLRLQQVLRYESGMSEKDWKRFRKFWKDSKPQKLAATDYYSV